MRESPPMLTFDSIVEIAADQNFAVACTARVKTNPVEFGMKVESSVPSGFRRARLLSRVAPRMLSGKAAADDNLPVRLDDDGVNRRIEATNDVRIKTVECGLPAHRPAPPGRKRRNGKQ